MENTKMDNEKIQTYASYLSSCNEVESETFQLYQLLSRKMNNPESAFIQGMAYDSLKTSKIIQSLLETLGQIDMPNKDCEKNLVKLSEEIKVFIKSLARIRNINNELLIDILKELLNLEDTLSIIYSSFNQSQGPKIITDEMSKLVTADLDNFKRIFELFVENKAEHRGTISEIIYYFEGREAKRPRYTTPVVKYQNPDAWIKITGQHNFANNVQ